MKNKLKLGQAAGVVAFAIIIGAVSMSSSSTVDARTSLKENRTVNAGVALGLTEAADATELLTAGVTSALTYYGADVSVAQNDSNVVTASAQGAQVGNTAQETEQANEASQTPTAAQTCGYTNLGMSVISSGNLNIRQEASTDSEVIGILTNHNACELLEDAGEWYKVTSGKVTGYVNKQYLVTGDEAEAIAEQEIKTVATVNTETLNVRAEKSTEAAVLSQVGNSEAFTVNSVADGWVEISVDDSVGYISQDYVTLAQALPTAKTIEQVKYGDGVSDVRASVVSYALQFVGNRYVWGGTSLTDGADCSGLVQQIYKQYGYSLPRVAEDQSQYGTKIPVEDAQPGDLIFYAKEGYVYHVVMYAGDGRTIEAASTKLGIIEGKVNTKNAVWATRILKDDYSLTGDGIEKANATEDMYGQKLENFQITYYCPCEICCDKASKVTASGTPVAEGKTIATDPNVIPYGTKVIIGGHVFTAEDTGRKVQGNQISIYVNNHAEVSASDTENTDVYLAK